MPVSPSDILVRYSGGASNTDPGASLGGAMSNTSPSSVALNNLFGDVTASESTAGVVKYRCVYVLNNHATDTLSGVIVWFNGDSPAAGTVMGLGLDPAGIGGTATTVVDENTAPSGVTFATPYVIGDALTVGDLAAGEAFAVWVRQTTEAGAEAYANDGVTLRIRGTPA